MTRQRSGPRKRRTREHIIADLGVNHVERHALLCGYTVERRVHDYGVDLVLLTYTDTGEEESGEVLIQVKATDGLSTAGRGRFAAVRIERAHLRAWLAEPMPVILIVYDVTADRAYWLYVQAAFPAQRRFRSARGSDRMTIRIPVDQVLDQAAVRRFRDFRAAVIERIQGAMHHDD